MVRLCRRPWPLALWASVVVGTAAYAQEPADTAHHPNVLPPLTVQGVRERSVAPPVATKEVDSLTLRRTQASDAWDLVRRTAGVEVHQQGQGPGFAADAVIRGFTSDHSADVLLSVDGVPINLPLHGHAEGYSDWNILFPAAADGLRVIHGPASPLYGDFAFGGVVEVTTPWAMPGTTQAVRGSSFGDVAGWALGGKRRDNQGWLAGGRLERSQGWRDHSSYLLGNGILRWRTQVGAGWLEGGVLGYTSGWDSPGFLSVADFNAGRLSQSQDSTDGGSSGRVVVHSRYTRLLGQHVGLSVLGWAQALSTHVYLNIPEGDEAPSQTDELDRRGAAGGEGQVTIHTRGGEISLGGSGRFDDVRYRLNHTDDRVFQDAEASYAGTFHSLAGFGRWRHLVGPLQLDLGLRLDALGYRSQDRLAGTPSESHTDVLISPKFGARLLASANVAVLGSVSRGFRGAPGTIADPTLATQTAWAKELAVELYPAGARLRLALFRLDVQHERIQDPITREISELGTSVRQGVQVDAEVPLTDRLRVTASGTFNDATVGESQAATAAVVLDRQAAPEPPLLHVGPLEPGNPVPGVSRYLARLALDSRVTSRVSVGGLLRLNGPFTPIGEPDVKTGTYVLFDLNGTVHPGGPGWAIDWELQNVFNTHYPEVRSSGYLNPGDPRAVRVALRF